MSDLHACPAASVDTDLAERIARHQHELRAHGYTIVTGVMDARQLAELRAAVDARLAAGVGITAYPDHYNEVNLVGKAAIFRELAAHPLPWGIAEGLLGSDCILSSCNQGTRRPGGIPQHIHRDFGIWGAAMPWLPLCVGVQTAWCVDDFHERNGATRIVPDSHLWPDARGDVPSITAEAPAGSMIMFDARTLHAGGANQSERLRRAVLTFYLRSWLKPQIDHKRSIDPALVPSLSPTLTRLLGFRRQSPVEHADGRSEILPAPGATDFYDY